MTQTSAKSAPLPFTDSMFYMWRCVIAVAHADGVLHEKESEMFNKVFASLEKSYALTDEHVGTFTKDIAVKQDINTLLPKITDPECRALLLFFAQITASVDGVLAYDEATLVGRLHGKIGSSPDTRDRVAEIRRELADRIKNRSAPSNPARNPIYDALDALLLRLGVDPVE